MLYSGLLVGLGISISIPNAAEGETVPPSHKTCDQFSFNG
jgi:hypothetical protein